MVCGRPQGCKQEGSGDRQVEESRQITITKSNRKHAESFPYIICITGAEIDPRMQNPENTAVAPLLGQSLSSTERG